MKIEIDKIIKQIYELIAIYALKRRMSIFFKTFLDNAHLLHTYKIKVQWLFEVILLYRNC